MSTRTMNVYTKTYDIEDETIFVSDSGYAMFAVVGASKTMATSRISYLYNFTGQSCSITSPGIWLIVSQGLEMAGAAIVSGECDTALIGGACESKPEEISLPNTAIDYLSHGGVPRSFDAEGNDKVRADAQIVPVLQRSDLAQKPYARVVRAVTRPVDPRSYDTLTPNVHSATNIIQGLKDKCGVDPAEVQYVE